MQSSPTIGALCAALAKAKTQYSSAKKDAKNPFFKSDYLTLAGAHGAADGALSAHGLAVLQSTCYSDASITLTTVLMHESGEWVSGTYPVNPVKNDPQGIGSAMTYARRYSYMAIVGLAAEDDDGNQASNRNEYTAKAAPVSVPVAVVSTSEKKPDPLTEEYNKVEKMLIAKMGKDEAMHQIQAIKKKNGTNYTKALAEIKALNDSTPVRDF